MLLSFLVGTGKNKRTPRHPKRKNIIEANRLIIYQEQPDGSLVRSREKKIGNTIYTVVARQKENAKETAFDITKRLIERSAESLIQQKPFEGCNSGG